MASLSAGKVVQYKRVCLRKRGRLKGDGSRAQFRGDVKVVSQFLGDEFVWVLPSPDDCASGKAGDGHIENLIFLLSITSRATRCITDT